MRVSFQIVSLLAVSLCFIRQSLATCLLLYGCERSSLLEIRMITEDEIKDLPSRFVPIFCSYVVEHFMSFTGEK
jgi:hypothetical protein